MTTNWCPPGGPGTFHTTRGFLRVVQEKLQVLAIPLRQLKIFGSLNCALCFSDQLHLLIGCGIIYENPFSHTGEYRNVSPQNETLGFTWNVSGWLKAQACKNTCALTHTKSRASVSCGWLWAAGDWGIIADEIWLSGHSQDWGFCRWSILFIHVSRLPSDILVSVCHIRILSVSYEVGRFVSLYCQTLLSTVRHKTALRDLLGSISASLVPL